MTTQQDKAAQFRKLHAPGTPLVLVNAWDVGSAKVVASAGAKAIATGSQSVAAALGYPDGQEMEFETLLDISAQLCAATDLPVSIDMEAGYGTAPQEVAANALRLIETGAVGINLEDQIVGTGQLYSMDLQAERISAVRDAATARGVDIFINARCDLFLTNPADVHGDLMEMAQDRARAYAEAGASGVFVPRLADLSLLSAFCSACPVWVNAMAFPNGPDLEAWTATGVARVSHGPFPYLSAMDHLANYAQNAIG